MNGRHKVSVLGAERLKSELAMFLWTQSHIWQERRSMTGAPEPAAQEDFAPCKKVLYAEVLKLAGLKVTMDGLIAQLKPIIALGTNEQIHMLDPYLMAGKISARTQ